MWGPGRATVPATRLDGFSVGRQFFVWLERTRIRQITKYDIDATTRVKDVDFCFPLRDFVNACLNLKFFRHVVEVLSLGFSGGLRDLLPNQFLL